MEALLNALGDPSSMSQAQWLVLAIAGFIVIGSLYFVFKLIKIMKTMGKTTYKPNIGLSRTGYKHSKNESVAVNQNADDGSVTEPENTKEE